MYYFFSLLSHDVILILLKNLSLIHHHHTDNDLKFMVCKIYDYFEMKNGYFSKLIYVILLIRWLAK